MENKYFDMHKLFDKAAKDSCIKYIIAFGKRSAGKSTSTCIKALENWVEKGESTVFCRRLDSNWTGITIRTYMNVLVDNKLHRNYVSELTNGEWDDIKYYAGQWFLCRTDEKTNKIIKQDKPFAYAVSINNWMNSKSAQVPTNSMLVLEEFIDARYLVDEFSSFLQLVSTFRRDRTDFLIVLLGNSIRYFNNPYFDSMGLMSKVETMQPGDCVIFSNDTNRLKILVEYTDKDNEDDEDNNIYYAFDDNSAARMITSGEWDITPKFPILTETCYENGEKIRIRPKDIIYSYFLKYRQHLLQADVILQDDEKFYTFFHKKTTEIKNKSESVIFDLDYHVEPYYRRDITHPTDNIGKKIASFFINDSVYCDSVKTAEILFSYIEAL